MDERQSNILREVAREFGVPILSEEANAWLIRADGGDYYDDYRINNYIAIGWNEISTSLILDDQMPSEEKNQAIVDILPDATRPGLIRGQLDTFLRGMKSGDFVAIPNYGGKKLYLGVLLCDGYYEDNVLSDKSFFEEDYKKCSFTRRRKVKWLKEISPQSDIYLLRVMRAHQTISNISENIDVLMRNLYDVYFRDGRVSLTLRYKSERPLNFNTQFALMNAIKNIEGIFASREDELLSRASLEMKMSVSSPGFLEFIATSPFGLGITLIVMLLFGAKFKYSSGDIEAETQGVPGILSAISDFTDRWQDRKIKREMHALEVEEKKIDLHLKRIKLREIDLGEQRMIEDAKINLHKVKVLQDIDIPELPGSVNF